ncbi:MAG: alpha/beta hydrolase [Geminicoccaceae bacterium]
MAVKGDPSPPLDPGDVVGIEAADGRPLKGRLWRASSNAPLLLVVHGVMSHSLWFHQLAHSLRSLDIALLAVDRRGAGLEPERSGEPGNDQVLVSDLAAWTDFAAAISDDLHLVGFCWGSNYALHYLGHHTDPIRSLILMAPGVAPRQTAMVQQPLDDLPPEAQLPIPLELEDFTQGPALEGFLRPDPLRLTHVSARFIGIQNMIGRWSAIRLVRLRLPLLTLLAEQDDISDNARMKALFERSSASPKTLIEVPGRHGIVFDAPGPVAAACRQWLDRLHGMRSTPS